MIVYKPSWKKRLFCEILQWHKVKEVTGFDGVSLEARCDLCGKKLLMDSQGNWF